jgi:HEAT repeat protein
LEGSKFDQLLLSAVKESNADNKAKDLKAVGDLIKSMSEDRKKSITLKQIDDLAYFLKDQNDVVRMYAAIALGRIGGPAERAIPALELALKNRAPSPSIVDPDLGSDSAIHAAIIRIRGSK